MLNDLLVIRCNVFMEKKKFEKLKEEINAQKESGVILLPAYCDAILVPKETTIGWLNKDGYPIIDAGGNEDDKTYGGELLSELSRLRADKGDD